MYTECPINLKLIHTQSTKMNKNGKKNNERRVYLLPQIHCQDSCCLNIPLKHLQNIYYELQDLKCSYAKMVLKKEVLKKGVLKKRGNKYSKKQGMTMPS